ncbi:MAG: hypothetical protein RIQ50_1576 [Bacteroidota bacterium]
MLTFRLLFPLFRAALLPLLLFFSISSVTRAQSLDTLLLKNGQLLSGELKAWEKGHIRFDIAKAGVVSVYFRDVLSLSASKKRYRLNTSDKEILFGTIEINAEEYLSISDSTITKRVSFEKVLSITPFAQKSINPIDGFISLGYQFAKSNKVGLVNLDGSLRYSTKTIDLTTSMSAAITHTLGVFSYNRGNVNFDINRLIDPKWSWGARMLYQRNLQQGLTARYLGSLGMIYNGVSTNNVKLFFYSGFVAALDRTVEGDEALRTEIPVLARLELYRFEQPEISLTTSQTLYFVISESRIRHDGEVRLNWKLSDKFSLNAFVYDNYDSKPLSAVGQTLDYGWVIGLRFNY